MSAKRASGRGVRVTLHCAHAGCGEEVPALAHRRAGSSAFMVRLPRGWGDVREDFADPATPQVVPALCPAHRPDPRVFVARSMRALAERIFNLPMNGTSRELYIRFMRYQRVVEGWEMLPPTEEQLLAMVELLARMRAELGLPPGLTSGIVPRPASRAGSPRQKPGK